mgnify:CR=1 FL=1
MHFSKKSEYSVDVDNGLSCGVSGEYYLFPKANLTKNGNSGKFIHPDNEYNSYLGLTSDISLYYGDADYEITVMIPKSDYSQMKLRDAVQWYFGRRYISPILNGLDRLKKSEQSKKSNIAEIDNLFDFISKKDSEYEKALAELSLQNEQAQDEINRVHSENERLQAFRISSSFRTITNFSSQV